MSSKAIIKETSYQYEPLLDHDGRRGRWLRYRWGSIINSAFSLALELGDQIPQYCLRQLAIVYEIISLDTFYSSDSLVSNATNIWVRHTVFGGIKYIASLTSDRPEGNIHASLISILELSSKLYITEDHLGIRDLLFASPLDPPARASRAKSGIWWRTPQFIGTNSRLQCRTDVNLIYTP